MKLEIQKTNGNIFTVSFGHWTNQVDFSYIDGFLKQLTPIKLNKKRFESVWIHEWKNYNLFNDFIIKLIIKEQNRIEWIPTLEDYNL